MSIVTQAIGQSVLDNVIRFKDLLTGIDLTVGTKYVYDQVASLALEARRVEKNDRAPMRFIYRNSHTQALIKVSSFDFHSYLCVGKTLEDYYKSYPSSEVETQIAPEFVIDEISHQKVDKSFSKTEITEDDFLNPKLRYPLYHYVGYTKYSEKRDKLKTKAQKEAGVGVTIDFRMPSKDIEKCRTSGISESSVGHHFKQLNLNKPLLWQDQTEIDAYERKLAAAK